MFKSKVVKSLMNEKDLDEISIQFFYLRHVNQNEKYCSIEIDMSNELVEWIKSDLKNNMQYYWNNDKNNFEIVDYNNELFLHDSIAEINLDVTKFLELKETKNKMMASTIDVKKDYENLKDSNFHLVRCSYDNDTIYFGFYRGMRKHGRNKKVAIFEKDKFVENDKTLIELGGSISFIIHDDYVYVIQPRNFEYAFRYSEHITKMRDENINKLLLLPVFPDMESKILFKEKASNHWYSRGLANMSSSSFDEINEYYSIRCDELHRISKEVEHDENQKKYFEEKKGILLDLIKLIDFDNNNLLKIDNDTNIKPLLHLFQDKIMERYLTKKVDTSLN